MARPRVHDERTRDRLLDVAGTLLRREGPAAMTVRRLADEAGVSTSAIYSLFGSKDDVVRAMHRSGFANLARHQEAATATDPVERIRELAAAYRAAARGRPHLYDVMFACPFPGFTPDTDDRKLASGTLDRLRAAVVEAVEADRLVGTPEVVTMGLWSTVHGLASLELAGSFGTETHADDVWSATVDAALAGLG